MNVLPLGHNKKQGTWKQLNYSALRPTERRAVASKVSLYPAGLATDKLERDSQ